MSLTQTAYTSRRLIKFGGIGIVAFSLLWVIVTTSYNLYRSRNPVYIAPTVKYGVLPRIVFPEKEKVNKSFNFELAGDAVPKFSDQAKVYVIYRPNTTFLALQEDTQTAKSFGFGYSSCIDG